MTVQEHLSGVEYNRTEDIIVDAKGCFTLYLWNNVTNDMQGREEIYQFVVQAINEKIKREKNV